MHRRPIPLIVVALCMASAAWLVPSPAGAQARQPTPNDTLVSPEVHSDSRITFRIYAPHAAKVALVGDWMETPGPLALSKDDQGVWSVTVGPLGADFYSYAFFVDEVRTLDPRNPTIKQGIVTVENMVFVPGAAAAFQENADVPHGDIRKVWYRSSTLDMLRRMQVYTPPGYDGGTERYPVLYLLHGGGDEDSGWSTIGRAGFILDNLLAAKAVVPMIIVMPNGSLPRPAGLPAPVPGTPPDPAVMAALQERFTSELMRDVVPFVESRFRVQANREHRAIAGLSMGGGQTLRVVTSHPDAFSYVAIWSAGVAPAASADFEKRAAAFLANTESVNAGVRGLWIAVGDRDFALPGSKNLSQLLQKHGIRHDLHVSGGGHTWLNWRQYLRELAPRLFRAGS